MSILDLFGIKTYDSDLPTEYKPKYLLRGDYSPKEVISDLF